MATASKKLQYKIGEACRELDIQPYVLRYWETEFPFLKPDKSKSGQRVYAAEELAIIRRVKELLYDEGYTIAGAKKKLEAELESGGPEVPVHPEGEDPSDARSAAERGSGRGESVAPVPEASAERAARLAKLRSGLGELLTQARSLADDLSA